MLFHGIYRSVFLCVFYSSVFFCFFRIYCFGGYGYPLSNFWNDHGDFLLDPDQVGPGVSISSLPVSSSQHRFHNLSETPFRDRIHAIYRIFCTVVKSKNKQVASEITRNKVILLFNTGCRDYTILKTLEMYSIL